jgi:MFS transporter, DHA2 family, multidrug resistance protein
LAIIGFGFGFFQAPNNCTLLSSTPRRRAAAAGGMLAIARLLGFTIGASLSGLIFEQNAEIAALVLGAILAACASAVSLSRLKGQCAQASPVSAE